MIDKVQPHSLYEEGEQKMLPFFLIHRSLKQTPFPQATECLNQDANIRIRMLEVSHNLLHIYTQVRTHQA